MFRKQRFQGFDEFIGFVSGNVDFHSKVESHSELDGVSIAQHLLHSKPLSARTLFWQHGEQYAVRKGKWKLVVPGNHEKPDILNELLDELEEWQKDVFEGVKIYS